MTSDDFKAWRARMRLSQDEAADTLGVSRASLQNYERGVRPNNGRPVPIPKVVRLACAALQHGVLDFAPG